MFEYKGKTALITGASMGIGEAFARELAERGMNLILVARSEDKMRRMADELSQKHSIHTLVLATDLSRENAAETVREQVEEAGITVDLLVNNAGFGTHGRFQELAAARDHAETMLNVVALQDLTHAFLPGMIERRAGGVINVASTAAFQPLPFMAVYGATKAFVLSFTEALWAEAKDYNVRVTALCPGATETPFFGTVGTEDAALGKKDTPEHVVAQGLRAFEAGKCYVIPRWNDWLLAQVNRTAPRSLNARIAKKLMRPGKNSDPTAAKLKA
jgi:short-subunit dehydrogenase